MTPARPDPMPLDDITLDPNDPQLFDRLPGNFVRNEDLPRQSRSKLDRSLIALIDHPGRWAVIRVYERNTDNAKPDQYMHSARYQANSVEGRNKSEAALRWRKIAANAGGHFETAVAVEGGKAALAARFVVEAHE